MKRVFKILFLGPLTLLYGLAVTVRNKFYDWHIFRSAEFPLPVIGVGNITVGGTGKTPHTELLVSILKDELCVAVLSRGYTRKTRGFRYVAATDSATAVGDEPLQIKHKFPGVMVAVDANRIQGIKRLLADEQALNVVVLDDAFQYRKVRPSLSMLLIDYHRPVSRDCLLPLGRLRDRKNQIRRADMVFITKCPPVLTPIEQRILSKSMRLYPYQQLYLTTFDYGLPAPVFPERYTEERIFKGNILLTGVANPQPLADYLKGKGNEPKAHLAFADHHLFTAADARKINELAQAYRDAQLLTTEKDAMRLRETEGLSDAVKERLFYIPITVKFLAENGEEKFRKFITNYVRKNKRNNILHTIE